MNIIACCLYRCDLMHGKIYHQTIFFPHLLPSFLVSFFFKFPIFLLSSLFFPLLQLQTPFFLCSFISRSYSVSLHCYFFLSYFPPQNLYLFILFYFTIWRPWLYFPCFLFATELYTQSDAIRQHSYLNMSRAETKKQAFQNPAISIGFHFLNISTAALLKHLSFSSSLCMKWKRNREAMPEHPRVYLLAHSRPKNTSLLNTLRTGAFKLFKCTFPGSKQFKSTFILCLFKNL